MIKEWEKQNPPPSQDIDTEMMLLAARELKKSKYCKDMIALREVLSPEQLKLIRRQYDITLQVETEDEDENSRSASYSVRIPPSFAKAQDIPYLNEYPGTIDMHNPSHRDTPIYKSVAEPHEFMQEKGNDFAATRAVQFPSSNHITIKVKRSNPTLVKMRKAKRQRKLWENKRNKLRDETRDVLDQIGSTKQLREQWPDMVPYLPPHIADPDKAITLPVLAIDRLSERLGLK